MKTSELRDELVAWVSGLKDRKMLEVVASLKEASYGGGLGFELTQGEHESLQRGLKDVEEGRVMGSAEFWRRYAGTRGRLD